MSSIEGRFLKSYMSSLVWPSLLTQAQFGESNTPLSSTVAAPCLLANLYIYIYIYTHTEQTYFAAISFDLNEELLHCIDMALFCLFHKTELLGTTQHYLSEGMVLSHVRTAIAVCYKLHHVEACYTQKLVTAVCI